MTGIAVLGPVAVGDEGASLSPRDRVVLSVLVARHGREVSADTLAEALWGEALPASWHKVVQGCVTRLRRRLGHAAIVTGRGAGPSVPPDHPDRLLLGAERAAAASTSTLPTSAGGSRGISSCCRSVSSAVRTSTACSGRPSP